MGYRHDRRQLLDDAVDDALERGLSTLTFGRLAKQLDVPDRTIVYYFPTKQQLVTEILMEVGARLQALLDEALPTPAADRVDLVGSVWQTVARPEHDRVFALFFEAAGLAAAGHEPYRTLAPALVESWIAWAAAHLDIDDDDSHDQAAAAVALLEGLLLVRQIASAEVAQRAADRLLAANPGAGGA